MWGRYRLERVERGQYLCILNSVLGVGKCCFLVVFTEFTEKLELVDYI